MSPDRLREYVLVVTTAPTGVFLAVYLPITHQFSAWQIPLLLGLFGIPFVAPRKSKEDESS